MVRVSSPGKVILFGEHAVVYGHPAVAVAVKARTEVDVYPASDEGQTTVNGELIDGYRHKHLLLAHELLSKGSPMRFRIRSRVPSTMGLGSSSALTIASAGGILALDGDVDPEKLAQFAFEIEYKAGGKASPLDTSTSIAGGAVALLPESESGFLWQIEKDGIRWCAHSCPVPSASLVIGYTGNKSRTHELVGKVGKLAKAHGFVAEIFKDIGRIALVGLRALQQGDMNEVGVQMNRNHELLSMVGVSNNDLDRLVEAAKPHSYGAKLTGKGGGGSMIALTDEPELVAEAIRREGGKPMEFDWDTQGFEIVRTEG